MRLNSAEFCLTHVYMLSPFFFRAAKRLIIAPSSHTAPLAALGFLVPSTYPSLWGVVYKAAFSCTTIIINRPEHRKFECSSRTHEYLLQLLLTFKTSLELRRGEFLSRSLIDKAS